MWYISIFLSVLFMSGTNIIDKILAKWDDRSFSLFIRYTTNALLLSILAYLLHTSQTTTQNIVILMTTGILNYLVIIMMYRGLRVTHVWLFFVVAYLYIVFLYFVNIALFGSWELFSIWKLLFGIWFLLCVLLIVYLTGGEKKHVSPTSYLYALGCALGWTVSIGISAYMTKTAWVEPVRSLSFEALGSSLFWCVIFLSERRNYPKKKYHIDECYAPVLSGITISIALSLLLTSYLYLPANIANLISLSELLSTMLLGYIFLHEKLEKQIVLLILVAFCFLIGFSWV